MKNYETYSHNLNWITTLSTKTRLPAILRCYLAGKRASFQIL